MNKILTLLLVMAAAVAMLTVRGTMASGDKVRGENGVGTVTQTCITPNYDVLDEEGNPTCPYGDYNPPETSE